LPPFQRLKLIFQGYTDLCRYQRLDLTIQEVHIEQLVRNTHIYTHYSVCAAGIAFVSEHVSVDADIPIQSWQAHCEWKGKRAPLEAYKERVSTEDELAAIGMGLWYVATKLI